MATSVDHQQAALAQAWQEGYRAGQEERTGDGIPSLRMPRLNAPSPAISFDGPVNRQPSSAVRILRVVLPIVAGMAYLLSIVMMPMPPVSLALSIIFYAALIGTCVVYSRTMS